MRVLLFRRRLATASTIEKWDAALRDGLNGLSLANKLQLLLLLGPEVARNIEKVVDGALEELLRKSSRDRFRQ